MLYLLHGTDSEKARTKAHEMIESLRERRPDAAFFAVDGERFDEVKFEELIGGQGLFERKYIVFLNGILGGAEARDFFLLRLEPIQKSENIFILLEGGLSAAILKKIEKHAEKVQQFGEVGAGTEKERRDFSLTDAFGRREKGKLWVLYQKALMDGAAPEEIHGGIFWQLKTMMVAVGSGSAKEAGLHPFVFQKSRDFAARYGGYGELPRLSSDLVSLVHTSRRGGLPLSLALEKFILSL